MRVVHDFLSKYGRFGAIQWIIDVLYLVYTITIVRIGSWVSLFMRIVGFTIGKIISFLEPRVSGPIQGLILWIVLLLVALLHYFLLGFLLGATYNRLRETNPRLAKGWIIIVYGLLSFPFFSAPPF